MSDILTDVMDAHAKKVLREEKGNLSETARRLGIHRRTLQRWQNDGETFRRKDAPPRPRKRRSAS